MATKQINHITFPRLSNAYHVAFFSNVKAILEKFGAETLKLDETVYDNFTGALDMEQDIVNRTRSSAYTRQLQEHDRVRDAYFRRIYYKLKNVENDINNEAITKTLVDRINTLILSQYGLGICAEANQKETAKLRGFIKDVKDLLSDDLDKLEISADLTNLESANNSYELAYINRNAEYAALPSSVSLREKTEGTYLAITFGLMTLANSTSTETAGLLRAKLCGKVVDELNILIKDFKSKAYSGSSASDEEMSDEEMSDEELNDASMSDEQISVENP